MKIAFKISIAIAILSIIGCSSTKNIEGYYVQKFPKKSILMGGESIRLSNDGKAYIEEYNGCTLSTLVGEGYYQINGNKLELEFHKHKNDYPEEIKIKEFHNTDADSIEYIFEIIKDQFSGRLDMKFEQYEILISYQKNGKEIRDLKKINKIGNEYQFKYSKAITPLQMIITLKADNGSQTFNWGSKYISLKGKKSLKFRIESMPMEWTFFIKPGEKKSYKIRKTPKGITIIEKGMYPKFKRREN